MNEVEELIYSYKEKQREIMLYFHQNLIGLNLFAKVNFKIPFYYGKKWVCYLNPKKGGSVELVFIKGKELSNSQKLLKSKGRKMVSGIEINDLKTAPLEIINQVIHEAILLDREPTKNKEAAKKKMIS